VHAGSRYGGGPVFGVRGTFSASDARQGFLAYDAAAGTIIPRVTTLVPATAVASVDAQARFEGRPAYAVTLTSGVLGEPWNRFAQARCEVLGEGGALLAGFRILGHDAERLWLAPEGLLPEVARIRQARVVAKDVDFTIGGFHGFGPPVALASGGLAPLANLRLGFAFHADPSRAVPSGYVQLRFPPQVGTFLYDLEAPGVVAAMRTRPFVQFEVLFDLLYAESLGAATPRVLGTGLPRPELRGLVVPYRF